MTERSLPTLLLTAFGPFGGDGYNPTQHALDPVAEAVAGHARVVTEVLPVEYAAACDRIRELIRAHHPDVVVSLGLAAGRTAITPERVAINLRDARIPDNAGASPVDEPVVPGAPVGRFSTLPIKAMVAALAADGVPAAVSQTAGTYVCNDVFYALQHLLATEPALEGIRGGFVHVPAADVLDSPTASRALVRMVEVALATTADARRPGGAEH